MSAAIRYMVDVPCPGCDTGPVLSIETDALVGRDHLGNYVELEATGEGESLEGDECPFCEYPLGNIFPLALDDPWLVANVATANENVQPEDVF